MGFIFPISCILALIFPILITYFPQGEGKGSFLKSQIKLYIHIAYLQIGSWGHNLPLCKHMDIYKTLLLLHLDGDEGLV